MSHFLLCGVPGPALDDEERRTLAELRPGGIILFARNVASRDQLRSLVGELRALPWRPYVSADVEGGRVNRLQAVVGPLPSPARAAAGRAPAVQALGEAIGAACAHFGIDVAFAPVVDVARSGGWLEGEDRCLGREVEAVTALAGAFLSGLERYGVAGCLKHYPGLGSGRVDSHQDLPLLDDTVACERRIFAALARPERAIMVAHALAPALAEGVLPSSLSPEVVGGVRTFHRGVVIADDLAMGALAGFGGLPERAAAALLAGCDQAPICNDMAARTAVVAALRRWSRRDPGLAARLRASARVVSTFGRGELCEVAWGEVETLAERARRLAGVAP